MRNCLRSRGDPDSALPVKQGRPDAGQPVKQIPVKGILR